MAVLKVIASALFYGVFGVVVFLTAPVWAIMLVGYLFWQHIFQ